MKFKTALNLDTIESDVESECKIYFPEEGVSVIVTLRFASVHSYTT